VVGGEGERVTLSREEAGEKKQKTMVASVIQNSLWKGVEVERNASSYYRKSEGKEQDIL